MQNNMIEHFEVDPDRLLNLFLNARNRLDYVAAKVPGFNPAPSKVPSLRQAFRAHVLGERTEPVEVTRYFEGKAIGTNVCFPRLGFYSIAKDNTAKWICIDIDGGKDHKHAVREPKLAALEIMRRLSLMGLKAYLESSGGGSGYHVWAFFSEPIPASMARNFGLFLCPSDIMLESGEFANARANKGIEVFPKQAAISAGGFGNFVYLPFWHGAAKGGNLFLRVPHD